MRSRPTAALLLLLHAIFLTTGFLTTGGSPAAAAITGRPAATTGIAPHAAPAWSSAAGAGDARLSTTSLSTTGTATAASTAAQRATARAARAENTSARDTTARHPATRHWGSPSAGRPAQSDQPRVHAGAGGPGATAGPALPPASASPRGGTRVTCAGPRHDETPAQRPRRTTAARAPPSTAY
ncbi:hypothetical protein [Microbispora amethystogenes]|uniref:Secreted protein n=1 Tax=Microbispora amethystogenes TaxID=1427754 RepID=A0ABQ4FKN4_9ACTN|nr:hypothetical protein [Microbispora amethystogenes]GIH35377.1 hypothetical protein Mam01_55410 [Microbispora amethystogenes]